MRLLAALRAMEGHEIMNLALTLGAIAFAVVTAVLLVRTRARSFAQQERDRAEITALRAQLDRHETLLRSEPQVMAMWAPGHEVPTILGTLGLAHAHSGSDGLALGRWLPAEAAAALEVAIGDLRACGASFSMPLTGLDGRHFEAEGRALGGHAVLRIREVSGAARELAALRAVHHKLLTDLEPVRCLVERLPAPIWARDAAGRLTWVNMAYAAAVEASAPADAVAQQLELLDGATREERALALSSGQRFIARLPVVVAGRRRVLDVLDVAAGAGSAGIGIDVTEVETMRAELSHMVDAHRRTLDQLPTAVASFNAAQRLTFCNAAYRELWGFDPEFLDGRPSDSAILDRLREQRRLPEQSDFRQWREQLHEAYRALEPKEHWWHLPDGRTLRVVTTPNPDGGITYVFDDVTERLDLERRFDALIRVQGETLENLAEGVAVFGSEGRLRLHNPAFARMWSLSEAFLSDQPHVEAVIGWCERLSREETLWRRLRETITGLENREPVAGRLERIDGVVVDCSTVPLPDGGTLVCFQDVTDSVNVERVLRERAEALEAADALKNDFVHHVSYELRTPLTNIIGFAHLLHDDAIGPLTEKQREYLGYISSSSAALLAIINDILDLASIDAGAMRLDLGPVDIRSTMEAAAEGVRDRLAEHGLKLDIRAQPGIGSFVADERRVRQILFNLLSNAIAFSEPGGLIVLEAERRPDALVLTVADRGRGIPADVAARVFNRFETHALGSQHRGAGLGLSIVRSFVELHGGMVALESKEGQGTTVRCVFPLEAAAPHVAAA